MSLVRFDPPLRARAGGLGAIVIVAAEWRPHTDGETWRYYAVDGDGRLHRLTHTGMGTDVAIDARMEVE